MKTSWDYSDRARTYNKRPDYAAEAVDHILRITECSSRSRVCDIGAGSGHLTLPLLQRGLIVTAIEPNAPMAAVGKEKTKGQASVVWTTGTAETTGMESDFFDLVTFGSSFNVADRRLSLKETARILKPGGWFACIWNHRDLKEQNQAKVEGIIRSFIPDYEAGIRREDQAPIIRESGFFEEPKFFRFPVSYKVQTDDWCDAWNSHATIARQAGDKMTSIVSAIRDYITTTSGPILTVPYHTCGWAARLRN